MLCLRLSEVLADLAVVIPSEAGMYESPFYAYGISVTDIRQLVAEIVNDVVANLCLLSPCSCGHYA